MKEHAFIVGATQPLVGVLTEPPRRDREAAAPRHAAIFLNAGVIHRVGPSRLYVHLARGFAAMGCLSIRFDHSGIGDSPVRRDGLPFEESSIAEVREVMDWLQQTRRVQRFILVGLCSGAVTSFDAAVVDERVDGIVMINPQGFDQSAEWNAYVLNRSQAKRYWTRSLFSLESWKNAFTGRVDYRRLATVLWSQMASGRSSQAAVASVATRVASDLGALARRGVQSLLVCSEGDEGIEYMNVIVGEDVRRLPSTTRLAVQILPGADHSLTLLDSQRRVVEGVCRWAQSFAFENAGEAPSAATGAVDAALPSPAVGASAIGTS